MQDEERVRRERGVLERCSCDGSKKKVFRVCASKLLWLRPREMTSTVVGSE